MSLTHQTHAWSGLLPDLVAASPISIMDRLVEYIPDSSREQRRAWRSELDVLQREGAQVIELHPQATRHSTVLEYQLPREAGRRPDVIVLQNGRVVVLEFKETGQLRRVDIDQVAAYARDLRGYHSACESVEVVPVLVLCGKDAKERTVDGVRAIPADALAGTLVELGRSGSGAVVDVNEFVTGEYAPLPTLVAAARLLFDNLPLPHIRRAHSAGVHEAVERILREIKERQTDGRHRLILTTGVPGAGKTLVGLQVAHSAALDAGHVVGTRRTRGAPATFLSGNGPLVQVLQHALKSTAFVQDMHRFIREYGLQKTDKTPSERLIVFDEAQRAWDKEKIADFYSKKLPELDPALYDSEPGLLANIAERMTDGATVLALVGEGQEIHTGEEGGLGQWAEAIATQAGRWSVLGPAAHAPLFTKRGLRYEIDDILNLDVGLRYHAAEDLHRWVSNVLDKSDLRTARPLATKLRAQAFPIYVTRDLDAAKAYVRERYASDPNRRFGLLASSKSEKQLAPFGVDAGFQATKQIKIGDWFNAEPKNKRSCCQLEQPITEFQCQGLELDFAIVCWSNDFIWANHEWNFTGRRPPRMVRDPKQLRTNAYRVLLTRGREGIIIWVPDDSTTAMDETFGALIDAGAVEVRSAQMQAAA